MATDRQRPPATLAGINYLQGFTAPQPTAASALRTALQKAQSQAEETLASQLPQADQSAITTPVASNGGMDTLGSQPTGIFQTPQANPTSSPTLSPTPAPQVPVGQGTVLQTPQVPSMESVGLNPLTTEPQFGGVAQTPSLQPQFDAGVAETQARLGAMFGEAPQTLSQLTAQDPASIAAQQASDAFAAESMAREARLEATLADRAAAREAQRGGDSGGIRDSQFRALSGGDQTVERQLRAQAELGMGPFSQEPTGLTPEQQVARERLELDKARFEDQRARGEATVAQENREAYNKDVAALQQVFADTERVRGAAGRAGSQTGFWTAGFFSPLRFVGGTGAADLRGSLTEVQADAAFDTLRAMKEASPTGGALGQVSNKEIELLGATRGSLEQSQSPEQLKANLERYQKLRNDIMQRAKQGFIATYGQEAFNNTFGQEAGVTADSGEFVTEGGEAVQFTVEEV